jgi:hypothetical protein
VKEMLKVLTCCLLIVLVCSSVVLGLEIANPLPKDLVELDNTRDGINFAWQSDFAAKDSNYSFELWQVHGNNKIIVVQTVVKEPKYFLEVPLLVGRYIWRVSAFTGDAMKIISPIWQFFCKPWFDIYIDKTSLLLFTRSPGEFTMKWTKVMLASNANIRLVFEKILLVDEHNNILPAVFGFKQGKNPVVWQTGQWQMFFEKPLKAQEFELWLKITADAKVSAGDYRGIIKMHVLMEED